MAGLAGLAAPVAGGQFGWTLPLLWFAVAMVVPESPPVPTSTEIAAWMFQPGDSVAANWTAVVAAAVRLGARTEVGRSVARGLESLASARRAWSSCSPLGASAQLREPMISSATHRATPSG